MNEENEKKQKIAELIAAIKKAKGIDSEITPENISVSEDEIIDSGIESVQGNGGMSESAMEADYEAEQNSRPGYLDENGNPVSVSKKEKVVEAINKLPLSRKQKNLLYLSRGYSEKDLNSLPWN